jgi:hypothetical protein
MLLIAASFIRRVFAAERFACIDDALALLVLR